MKGIALQPISHTERAADKPPRRGHEHARAHKEEVPALLAQVAVLDVPAALRQLGVSERGLPAAEVQRRRAECGENRIAQERRESRRRWP